MMRAQAGGGPYHRGRRRQRQNTKRCLLARQQSHGFGLMIPKASSAQRILRFQEFAQADPVNEGSSWIAGQFRRAPKHVGKAGGAASSNRKNAESFFY